ncbi:LysR family transcriptional regulator [Vibrio hibernica]|uniref:LysR family transcriptional regulator n=1 Tax=Vibrio hibernica TaxID=2587465 RepID=UPI00187E42FC|nr:LysR family transcriptional regulator [Vibrio hibernica]
MDVSYRQLKAFLILADTENFTQAAEQIHITQSALSQMMKKLALQMSTELFEKKSRKIILTDSGEVLYQEARLIVNRLDKLVQNNKNRNHGYNKSLVVSSLYTICASLAPKTFGELKIRYPDFTFRLIEERMDDITQSVLEHRADIGINIDPHHPDLKFELLYRDHLRLACRHDHPLSKQKEVSWEQAHKYATIGVSPGNSLRNLANEAFERIGLSYNPELSAAHTSTLIGMIQNGLGTSILSSTIEKLTHAEDVIFIPIVKPIQYRHIGIITRKETQQPLIDEFRLILKKHVNSWNK